MLFFYFLMAITVVSAEIQGIEGETINIMCDVVGTLPRWTKDTTITLTLEGTRGINPQYAARFSYAADQKTLVVSPIQSSDQGTYVCSIGGVQGSITVAVTTSSDTRQEPSNSVSWNTSAVVLLAQFILRILHTI